MGKFDKILVEVLPYMGAMFWIQNMGNLNDKILAEVQPYLGAMFWILGKLCNVAQF